MGLNEYKEDLIVRYNHILNKRVTFKQKTAFIRSLMMEFKDVDTDIKVVEVREKGKKTSLARNVYVGDVKKADVIISTYYDSPLMHLGPYYLLDKNKQRNATLYLNLILSLGMLLVGALFTMFVTNKHLKSGAENFSWPTFIIFGLVYVSFIYLIGLFAKGIGRRRNTIRNNATVIYMIYKIMSSQLNKKVAFAFLDSGVTNERGLYALQESAKRNAKIIYLDAIASSETLYCMHHSEIQELLTYDNFESSGLYRIFSAAKKGDEYYLTQEMLNHKEESTKHINVVDRLINRMIK
ncbi:MAG: hypothetical protein Q4B80_00060 [Aerococcaceae bacterium]|nr:hypothetical protein [Aerococcaceae bacterium]